MTTFYKATHKVSPEIYSQPTVCDSDIPEEWLSEVHRIDPLTNGNWIIQEVNVSDVVMNDNVDWRTLYMHLTLGEFMKLFG